MQQLQCPKCRTLFAALSTSYAPCPKCDAEALSNAPCSVPRDLLERILEYLSDLQDEGPTGSGWKSKKLIADMNTIVDLLGLPEDRKWRF